MIHVIATIETAPGRREEFLQAFHELVPAVQAEKGCLEYGPAVDLATELAAGVVRADAVTVIEKWETEVALKDHLNALHMQQYREKVKDLVIGVEIRVLEAA